MCQSWTLSLERRENPATSDTPRGYFVAIGESEIQSSIGLSHERNHFEDHEDAVSLDPLGGAAAPTGEPEGTSQAVEKGRIYPVHGCPVLFLPANKEAKVYQSANVA